MQAYCTGPSVFKHTPLDAKYDTSMTIGLRHFDLYIGLLSCRLHRIKKGRVDLAFL